MTNDTVVIISNGGPHPADKWAAVTAAKISGFIQVDEVSTTQDAAAARKAKPRFEIAIADALEPIFTQAAADERSRVESGSVTSRSDGFCTLNYAEQACATVISTAGETPFHIHFSEPAVQAVVISVLEQNIIDAMNIERSWAFDAKGL